ncbi:hypothetical protein [Cohnella luojiensis]|uniref:Uncharacterized protein n=1 Tax=Cohnella luojiensis TaxID=652876 RepID=A0A4Y8LUX4_9BACL|nr:hypothetical protein [Cohnella luojiensis]TFE25406.1 hypothetical protein E2980_13910 [Cohnella luojiensis]
MESVIFCIIAYVILLWVGLRSIRKKGLKREMVWYTGLVGWCFYMTVAQMFRLPSGSIIHLQKLTFAPMGQWIRYMLEGST